MKPGRIPCCIIGCGRTFAPRPGEDFSEFMCGRHYRLSDKKLRALRTALRRRTRKAGRWTHRNIEIDNWLWERVKRQATERSLGI